MNELDLEGDWVEPDRDYLAWADAVCMLIGEAMAICDVLSRYRTNPEDSDAWDGFERFRAFTRKVAEVEAMNTGPLPWSARLSAAHRRFLDAALAYLEAYDENAALPPGGQVNRASGIVFVLLEAMRALFHDEKPPDPTSDIPPPPLPPGRRNPRVTQD